MYTIGQHKIQAHTTQYYEFNAVLISHVINLTYTCTTACQSQNNSQHTMKPTTETHDQQ